MSWISVFDEIFPTREVRTKSSGTEFYLSGHGHVGFINNGTTTDSQVGQSTLIDTVRNPFKTSVSFKNNKIVKRNQYPGFRQLILVSTDGVRTCSASVTWMPNPGEKYPSSMMADGTKRLFQAHAEDIACAIGNE